MTSKNGPSERPEVRQVRPEHTVGSTQSCCAFWDRTADYLERVHSLESFAKLFPIEHRLIRTPPRQHRAVLAELQVPLTPDSFAAESPRRGLMRT